jgi:hypothetical protein
MFIQRCRNNIQRIILAQYIFSDRRTLSMKNRSLAFSRSNHDRQPDRNQVLPASTKFRLILQQWFRLRNIVFYRSATHGITLVIKFYFGRVLEFHKHLFVWSTLVQCMPYFLESAFPNFFRFKDQSRGPRLDLCICILCNPLLLLEVPRTTECLEATSSSFCSMCALLQQPRVVRFTKRQRAETPTAQVPSPYATTPAKLCCRHNVMSSLDAGEL